MSNWARYVNMAVGLWWMAAPAVLGYGDPARANDRIIGPVAATFAIIAIWETTRELRRVNLVLGVWQLLAPWALPLSGGAYPADATLNSMLCGAVLAACSLVRGEIQGQYGGGWRVLWRGDPRRVQPDQR